MKKTVINIIGLMMLVLIGCVKKEDVEPDPPETLVYCEECEPLVGEYILKEIRNIINPDEWVAVPCSVPLGYVYEGSIALNQYSKFTWLQKGTSYNITWDNIHEYDYNFTYNFEVISDSTLRVIEPDNILYFFPYLSPQIEVIDTIIWGGRRYVRE